MPVSGHWMGCSWDKGRRSNSVHFERSYSEQDLNISKLMLSAAKKLNVRFASQWCIPFAAREPDRVEKFDPTLDFGEVFSAQRNITQRDRAIALSITQFFTPLSANTTSTTRRAVAHNEHHEATTARHPLNSSGAFSVAAG